MSLRDLLAHKATIENEIQNLKESIVSLDEQIAGIVGQRLSDLRTLQGKEFGAVNMNVDGIKVTETITKKVEWDQDVLTDIFGRITAAGDDPLSYMRQKFDVPEKMYGEFPSPIKNIFDEARVVKAGKPAIKFEDFEK